MKHILLIAGLFLTILAQGCHRQPQQVPRTMTDIKIVRPDSPPPSGEKADLIIYSHVKKRLPAKPEEKPYTYFISIDGQEFKETVKGVKETTSEDLAERGEGVRHELALRLRLDPGVHKVVLRTEEGISTKTEIELVEGKVHALSFVPVYRSFTRKFGFPKSFKNGVSGFTVYLNGRRVWEVH